MSALSTAFRLLTEHEPFPWQQRLYDSFVDGQVPSICSIPTGLGKTAVIPIWLIALACTEGRLPRRLVYVVDRRTVVDQATMRRPNMFETALAGFLS